MSGSWRAPARRPACGCRVGTRCTSRAAAARPRPPGGSARPPPGCRCPSVRRLLEPCSFPSSGPSDRCPRATRPRGRLEHRLTVGVLGGPGARAAPLAPSERPVEDGGAAFVDVGGAGVGVGTLVFLGIVVRVLVGLRLGLLVFLGVRLGLLVLLGLGLVFAFGHRLLVLFRLGFLVRALIGPGLRLLVLLSLGLLLEVFVSLALGPLVVLALRAFVLFVLGLVLLLGLGFGLLVLLSLGLLLLLLGLSLGLLVLLSLRLLLLGLRFGLLVLLSLGLLLLGLCLGLLVLLSLGLLLEVLLGLALRLVLVLLVLVLLFVDRLVLVALQAFADEVAVLVRRAARRHHGRPGGHGAQAGQALPPVLGRLLIATVLQGGLQRRQNHPAYVDGQLLFLPPSRQPHRMPPSSA